MLDLELLKKIKMHQKELAELRELAHKALELLEHDPRYVEIEKKVKVYRIDDEPKHTAWYSRSKFNFGPLETKVKVEEKTVKELIENPDKETVGRWLAEARPVAERLKVLLSLFPVRIEKQGYQRFIASDGTLEDYEWYEFKAGEFFGALGISIPQFSQLKYFIRSVEKT